MFEETKGGWEGLFAIRAGKYRKMSTWLMLLITMIDDFKLVVDSNAYATAL